MVFLYEDFCAELVRELKNIGISFFGLHANPQQSSVEDFLSFLDKNRAILNDAEKDGITVEYYLHALNYLLPREYFEKDETAFRKDENGVRTSDYNCCPSSSFSLQIIEERAFLLAKLLKQKSHRYHLWTDDDFGGDVKCNCEKCKNLSASKQNEIIYAAILKGLKKYDSEAKIAYLVYGEEIVEKGDYGGMFLEFAPFKRMHGVGVTDRLNEGFERRFDNAIKNFSLCDAAVLEYFLSYDYAGFCSDCGRVLSDLKWYKEKGVKEIGSFVVFPEKDYIKKYGFYGIKKYAEIKC